MKRRSLILGEKRVPVFQLEPARWPDWQSWLVGSAVSCSEEDTKGVVSASLLRGVLVSLRQLGGRILCPCRAEPI